MLTNEELAAGIRAAPVVGGRRPVLRGSVYRSPRPTAEDRHYAEQFDRLAKSATPEQRPLVHAALKLVLTPEEREIAARMKSGDRGFVRRIFQPPRKSVEHVEKVGPERTPLLPWKSVSPRAWRIF